MLATIVLTLVLAIWTAAWSALLGRFWYLRQEFDIRARSPTLVVVSLLTDCILSSSVLWHWLLRSMGKTLPCYVIFVISYATLAFGVTPYLIRAIRVVVAYNRGARTRYAKFVKWKTLMGVWAVMTAILAVRGFFFYGSNAAHYSSDARECFYLDDYVALGAAVFLGGGPMVIFATRLLKVNDAFKLREELALKIGICAFLGGVVCGVQVLVMANLVEETVQLHIAVEAVVLLYGMNAAVWSVVVPLVAYQKSLRARHHVVPVESNSEVGLASGMAGVLAIARAGGEIGESFAQFCRKHLCLDSWDFIVAVCKYETMASSAPDDQFDAFVAVLDQFLLETSPDEVNISSTMNKRIVSFRKRENFCSLDDEARRTIFQEATGEVARMLDQNLLFKFQSHIVLQKEMELAKVARGDRELMQLMRVSSVRSLNAFPQ